jgi:hypothetical protein
MCINERLEFFVPAEVFNIVWTGILGIYGIHGNEVEAFNYRGGIMIKEKKER